MPDVCYRTGQAAKVLGLSSYQVRRLAESGLIGAEYTGSQWRIPAGEVDRLLKDGIPEIPANDGQAEKPAPVKPIDGLLAPPSATVVTAAEEVAITEQLLKRRRLELELREVEERLEERDQEEAERLAAEEREEQTQLAAEEAQQRREEWLQAWEGNALSSLPYDAPPEVRLEVHEAVRKRLMNLRPVPADHVTRGLVDAEVEKSTAEWRYTQEIEAVLIEARDEMLPYAARESCGELTEWQVRAVRQAGSAIGGLRDGASVEEIRYAAKQAVAGVTAEFQAQQAAADDRRMRDQIVCWTALGMLSLNLSAHGREQAEQVVAAALAELPPGTPREELEQARDRALAPFRAAVAQCQEEERRKTQSEWRKVEQQLTALAGSNHNGPVKAKRRAV